MRLRPFRFGVAVGDEQVREAWASLAREVEDLGYATFLWADHPDYTFATAVALQAAADATTVLRVGSMVFNNDFRHPAMLAKEAATLDVLTGGRLELGIGAGWKQSEYDQLDLPFDPPKIRIARFEEAIRVIKGLFADEALTFAGTHYKIKELNGLPKPVQKPHPPLLIGGGGRRILSIAACEADIVGIHFNLHSTVAVDRIAWNQYTTTALAEKVVWVREAAGPRFDSLELTVLVGYVDVTDHYQQGVERFRQQRGWSWVTDEDILDTPYALIGSTEQIVEKLMHLREQYGISYISLPAAYRQAFAPVVARLSGRA